MRTLANVSAFVELLVFSRNQTEIYKDKCDEKNAKHAVIMQRYLIRLGKKKIGMLLLSLVRVIILHFP